ncbi:TetR/AcrR family transcriptional regulator [Actinomyces marmotae]|uniref:TetR/AcrR family transcriptional regulator n=1 Tax=Actinomyces marmotae TaxID=2737173 RepID=A0A6M8B4F7_9ACTO|nr:TetR/AcrR family transcriptional regulator [Actinomyces marmotae]QKD79517.1 TetR/AcrR family transcriptional regulator [Actinomyces marmotae]
MPRVSKPAAERREEILDAAERLFAAKGVSATTTGDILDAVGIAKGTLYYHFTSKDAILSALIERTAAMIAERAAQAAASGLPAPRRFMAVIGAMRVKGDAAALIDGLHDAANTHFHLLSLVTTIRALTPILVGVVEDGIAEGSFTCSDPRTTIEILLTSGAMLVDEGIFTGEADQAPRRMAGVLLAAEALLSTAPGALTGPAAPASPEAEG